MKNTKFDLNKLLRIALVLVLAFLAYPREKTEEYDEYYDDPDFVETDHDETTVFYDEYTYVVNDSIVNDIQKALKKQKGDVITLNNNEPYFTIEDYEEMTNVIQLSNLDELKRCGSAIALLSKETTPAKGEKRGSIGMVKPSGFVNKRYDDQIKDKYLFNRCHLIGWQLSGLNAEPKNLITCTRYANATLMLEYENEVANYIKEDGNKVLYRVTPIYTNDNLVADGILMEGQSMKDGSFNDDIKFNVYLKNIQPTEKGTIVIDYKTGESHYEK